MKAKRKIYKSEIVWIVIASLFGIAALFFGIIGIVERYLPVNNWISRFITQYNNAFNSNLPFTVHATIYLAIGLAIYLISTLVYANYSETRFQKRQRRQ